MFTNNEKVDMILIYGEAQKNPRRAVDIYRERYPERRAPNANIFARLERILRGNENAFSSRKGKQIAKSVCNDTNVARVLEYFENNPRNSIRQAVVELDIKRSSIQRILKSNGYHDFKLHNLEYLSQRHFEKRLNYITQMMVNLDVDNRLFQHILWSDESRFISNGIPNRRNEHYWATENPYYVNPIQNQGHYGINVWCGIIGRHLIGPYFYDHILDTNSYLRFLRDELPQLLENVPLQLRLNMWFQHDGAPPHKARRVQQYLNDVYPDKWIGINGPIEWPPKSPDLTPLDFFLWGTLKNEVYKTPTRNLEHLKDKIRSACENISRDMLIKASTREVRKRLDKCLEVGGMHIENFF